MDKQKNFKIFNFTIENADENLGVFKSFQYIL